MSRSQRWLGLEEPEGDESETEESETEEPEGDESETEEFQGGRPNLCQHCVREDQARRMSWAGGPRQSSGLATSTLQGTTVGEPLQMGQHRRQGDIPFRRKNPFRIGAEFPGHSRHIANLNMVELFGGEP
jgi:hypothetical protein